MADISRLQPIINNALYARNDINISCKTHMFKKRSHVTRTRRHVASWNLPMPSATLLQGLD